MLKQTDMTARAACVLAALPVNKWLTVPVIAEITGLPEPRCQLLLTQFSLAGLITGRDNYTLFKRL